MNRAVGRCSAALAVLVPLVLSSKTARADDGSSTEEVHAVAASPAETAVLVAPVVETPKQRRERLKTRRYPGGPVPSGMHVEDRYTRSQLVPLYVGVPVFAGAYGLAALVALKTDPIDGVLLVPVAGVFIRSYQAFDHIDENTGTYAGLGKIADFFIGTFAALDGIVQVAGLSLTIVGIAATSAGPRPHLVADEAHAARKDTLHVALRPLFSVGGASASGVGLTVAGF